MDEIDRGPTNEEPRESAPREENGGAPPEQRGPSVPGQRPGAPTPWRGGDRDGARRRRGRRGRGGAPRPPGMGPGVPPFRPAGAAVEEDEGSAQARELAAYERRQRQSQQRGGWRGGPARPWSPGAGGVSGGGGATGRPSFGAPRPPFRTGGMRPGGGRPPQRYQEMIRRATAGPRVGPPEEAGEPIAGPHAVLEALRAGRPIRRIYVAQERGIRTGAVNDLLREAQERRLQVLYVDRMDVQRLSPGVEHQGVVAIAEGRAGVDLDELLLHLGTLTEPPLVLIIDSLQDPQNFGVLLRSAEGAGADGVVIPRHRQVGLTPAVSRTSAGATEHLMIAEVANLRQAIDTLKERGIWVVGTDDSGDLEWDAVDYRGATAVVIGGEGEGIRRLVLEGCDQVVRIPMQGEVSSLNAAAAGTVVLFEALRQRMRDAAPAVSERRAPLPPRGDVPQNGDAGDEDEEPATDLARDEDAPAGDEIRGDDADVEDFEDAAEGDAGGPDDEERELDTDAADALPPTAAAPENVGEPEKPKRAPRRATKATAADKATVKKTAAKRTTRKKTTE